MRMKRQTLNRRDALSKRWAPGRRESSLYLHMLDEDVRHHVVPIGGSRWNRDFAVNFDAEKSERERAVTLLTSVARRDRGRDEEVVTESIRGIAAYMLQNGLALFEILSNTEEPPRYGLASFPSQNVFRIPGRYVQFIPRHARAELGASHVVVPAEKVWRVAMPPQLGGTRAWRRLQRDLKNYTDLPRSYGDQLASGAIPPGYDFSETVRMTRYFLLRCTRALGWLGRDNSVDSQTEFFVVYRTLTFEWAAATLRDHILTQVNALFARLGIRAAVTLRGVLSPDEILSMRSRMSAGDVDFSEVLNRIYGVSED